MIREPKVYRDGFAGLIGGINSGINPSLVRDDQLFWAYNVTLRGGFVQNRPGFNLRELTYPTDEIASWIKNGLFQGVGYYSARVGPSLVIISVAGRIFSIDPTGTYPVAELTPTLVTLTTKNFTVPALNASVTITVDDPNRIEVGYPISINGVTVPPPPIGVTFSFTFQVTSISGNAITLTNISGTPGLVAAGGSQVVFLDVNSPILGKVWMKQAERFFIIQDGQSSPIIFDGSKVRRSDTTMKEVPVGTAMEYGQGRLWVAVNGNQFVASDIVFGPTGTPQYNLEDAILKFTENTYLAGGGAFNVPAQANEITALVFAYVQNTATGQGPLMVFTENFVFSVDASPDRDTWQNTRSPIKTTVLNSHGALSAQSTVVSTNGDIFYRAIDGLRSLILAIRDFGTWGNTQIGNEMSRALLLDQQSLLKFSYAIEFDNRLLFTVQPVNNTYNAYHRAIGALDYNLISSLSGKVAPAYEGIWTGINPYGLVVGTFYKEERAFAFSRNQITHETEMWEISKTDRFDNGDIRIVSMIETRSMFFGNAYEMKRIENSEMWLDLISGTVDLDLFYREDQYPCWRDWGNRRTLCSIFETCEEDVTDCHTLTEFRDTYKTRLCFGQPPDLDDSADQKPARLGYEFQFRLVWTGKARIKKALFKCVQVDEEPTPPVYDT